MSDTSTLQTKASPSEGETTSAFPLIGPDVAIRIGEAMMQNFARHQGGMADFMSHRLSADVEFQRRVVTCKTPSDVFEAFTEFTRTAMQDYTDHIGRMQAAAAGAPPRTPSESE